jgi:hypothetical protein
MSFQADVVPRDPARQGSVEGAAALSIGGAERR